MGKMQANLQRLQAATNKAGDALRKRPNDTALQETFQKAVRNEEAFTEAYRPIRAVGKNTLPELQGNAPLDPAAAGSYTGLARRFREAHGRDMTAAESIRTQSMAEKASQRQGDYMKANGDIYKRMETEYGRIRTERTSPPTLEDIGRTFSQIKEVCG
jgi:hypothetical protein